MRAIPDYRPARLKKIRAFFLALLLMVTAFMAGALSENIAHFSQDVLLMAPVALDGMKTFLRERAFYKFNTVERPIMGTSALSNIYAKEKMYRLIRGP